MSSAFKLLYRKKTLNKPKIISDKLAKLPKVIAIIGPTATGKSDLAVFIAKKFHGEIISADSRQIYKGMDIGTGKVTKKEMAGVPHHLLSFANPAGSHYNVSKFKKAAEQKIAEIAERGHMPILCGGTGFWIDAVAFNQNFPEVRPNPKLRNQLKQMNSEQLFKMLKKLDAKRAANIDRFNTHRLIRAIEIAKSGNRQPEFSGEKKFDTLFIGLDAEQSWLDQKIQTRLKKRLARGMIAEVKRLHQQGVSWKRLESFGLEYRYLAYFLQGKMDRSKMEAELFVAIRHYAKRQRTWFKRNKEIHWLDAQNKKLTIAQSSKLVQKFIK